ncbi:hypothetical protein FACS1894174_05900 [Bacteroidia bacterium]|nr:hypothetical protein FACS189455_2970 [Bacteroidia bacterium]GHV21902.1 hypothetical protein FACS1894174_05900 [Bacteroidia bacterium]
MIDPRQRKDLILLLEIIQNEEIWDNIYMYVKDILKEDYMNENLNVASEPTVKYEVRNEENKIKEVFSKEQIKEIIEAYDLSEADAESMSFENYFNDYRKRRCLIK